MITTIQLIMRKVNLTVLPALLQTITAITIKPHLIQQCLQQAILQEDGLIHRDLRWEHFLTLLILEVS